MKIRSSLCSCFASVLAVAAICLIPSPAPAQLPRGLPFPLKEEPYQAVVIEKKGTPWSFTLKLQHKDGINTITMGRADTSLQPLFEHLVVGQTYEFPTVIDSFDPARIPAPMPVPQPARNVDELYITGLDSAPPFRALVVTKIMGLDSVTLKLRTVGSGRDFSWTLNGNTPLMADARRLLIPLREGIVHEFPDIYKHPSGEEIKPAPPSPEIAALQVYIGEWEGGKEDVGLKIKVRYTWKNDGQGIWRDVTTRIKEGPPRPAGDSLITYDPLSKTYVETYGLDRDRSPMVRVWDATTRTFSGTSTDDRPEPGCTHQLKHVFVTDDQLDWIDVATKDGRTVGEYKGSYTRVK